MARRQRLSTGGGAARSPAAVRSGRVACCVAPPPDGGVTGVAWNYRAYAGKESECTDKTRTCARGLANRVRHQDRVHHLAGPQVVPLAVALALEAELLVQLDRGLVPREHVQLELAHAGCFRPADCRLEQRPP